MGAADGSIFTRHTASVGGFDVSYLKGGADGDLDPVLYLHGMGGAGKWEAFHMALGTTTMTYVPQLPGWREGKAPEGITSVEDYTRVVVDLIDALDLERVTLAGHSIGGWIALQLAVRHPERISSLILSDVMGLDVAKAPASKLGEFDEDEFATAVFGKLGMIATAGAYGFGAEWENVRKGPEFERQWKGRGLVADLIKDRSSDPDLTSKLSDVTASALLVWGRLDGIAPMAHGDALRAALPNAKMDVIDRCGHLPMAEKPETFSRLLRNFLLGLEEEIPDVVRI
jgi:pimeloyl-ACP methyl ester carboxylesterase